MKAMFVKRERERVSKTMLEFAFKLDLFHRIDYARKAFAETAKLTSNLDGAMRVCIKRPKINI